MLILGYESERRAGNSIHPILGTGSPSVTYGPAGLRRGTLTILCEDAAAAAAMEALHLDTGTFELTGADLAIVDMVYVPAAMIRTRLDAATRHRWIVEVDFQEVAP